MKKKILIMVILSSTLLISCGKQKGYEVYDFHTASTEDPVKLSNSNHLEARNRKQFFGRDTTNEEVEAQKNSPIKTRHQTKNLPSINFTVTENEFNKYNPPKNCLHLKLTYSGGNTPTLEFLSPSGISYLVTNQGSIGNSQSNEFTVALGDNQSNIFIPSEIGDWTVCYNKANNEDDFTLTLETADGAVSSLITVFDKNNTTEVDPNLVTTEPPSTEDTSTENIEESTEY